MPVSFTDSGMNEFAYKDYLHSHGFTPEQIAYGMSTMLNTTWERMRGVTATPRTQNNPYSSKMKKLLVDFGF